MAALKNCLIQVTIFLSSLASNTNFVGRTLFLLILCSFFVSTYSCTTPAIFCKAITEPNYCVLQKIQILSTTASSK